MEDPLPQHLWDYIRHLGHKADMAPSLECIRLVSQLKPLMHELVDVIELAHRVARLRRLVLDPEERRLVMDHPLPQVAEEIHRLDEQVAHLERVLSEPPICPILSGWIKRDYNWTTTAADYNRATRDKRHNVVGVLDRMDARDGWMGVPYTLGWYAERIKKRYGF